MAENFFGITDRGKIRDNNEDTFIAEKIAGGKLIAACVIDGVGGYEGGEIAARIARECITEHLHTAGNVMPSLSQAFIVSNEKIYQENQQRNQQQPMACVLTLAVADVEGNQFHYAHVGDTRLYLLRDDTLVKVTRDHSFVGFLEDSGRLSEEDAMKHPKRNEINKALGFDPQIQSYNDYIETGSSPFLPGDVLLLCSDGLTDMVSAGDITSILTSDASLQEKGQALVDAANDAGGKDNITVVLVHNNKKPLKIKAAKPAKKKVQAVIETPEEPVIVKPAKRRSNKTAMIILSALCVLSISAFLWMLFKNNNTQAATIAAKDQPAKERNAQEMKLQFYLDTVTAKIINLNDSSFGGTVLLTDTLFIDNDSFNLDGNGITLRAGEGYKGAAIVISEKVQRASIRNITFENFDVGLLAHGTMLVFTNVQFPNCRIPVQYQPTQPFKYINGVLATDTTFY